MNAYLKKSKYLDKFFISVVTEETDETSTKKSQKILFRRTVGYEKSRRFRQFHNQIVWIDVVGTEDGVAIANVFQNRQPCRFSVLQL